jgi:hypothetical protein
MPVNTHASRGGATSGRLDVTIRGLASLARKLMSSVETSPGDE